MKIKILNFGYYQKPSRKHYNDAGADCYIPENIIIKPHETEKINLKFGLEIPDGFAGFIITRSSNASNGLLIHIPPIDSGYRGPIHAVVTNTTDNPIAITKGDRVGQVVILPIVICDFEEELNNDRGSGAFGSTGK